MEIIVIVWERNTSMGEWGRENYSLTVYIDLKGCLNSYCASPGGDQHITGRCICARLGIPSAVKFHLGLCYRNSDPLAFGVNDSEIC